MLNRKVSWYKQKVTSGSFHDNVMTHIDWAQSRFYSTSVNGHQRASVSARIEQLNSQQQTNGVTSVVGGVTAARRRSGGGSSSMSVAATPTLSNPGTTTTLPPSYTLQQNHAVSLEFQHIPSNNLNSAAPLWKIVPLQHMINAKLSYESYFYLLSWTILLKGHFSTNLSKHVFPAFGQTEIWAFLVFGLFHLSLLRKVHQSPWKVFTHRGVTLGDHFPCSRQGF